MALAFLDLPTSSPEPITAAGSGPIGVMRAVLTDASCWRAVGYFMIKIVLAPVTFGDCHSWPSCPAPPVRSRWVHPLGVLALYLAVVVALPTTSGTGSAAGPGCWLTNWRR